MKSHQLARLGVIMLVAAAVVVILLVTRRRPHHRSRCRQTCRNRRP
ncbi:MAG: hypothetical protein ACYTGE_12070 [Planctomycetota bacterium]|jgi:hypothetical protein